MVEADAGALHAIHGACLTRSLLGHRYTQQQIEAWMAGRTPDGYVEAARGGERFIVADLGGEVVAYASWQSGELLSLFVHPDHQGCGIGAALAEACLAQAMHNSEPIGLVRATLGAEQFYERHGFKPIGSGIVSKRGVEVPHTRMMRPV